MLPTLGLPNLPLPLGLPDSVGSLAQGLPLAGDLPGSDAVSGSTPPVDEIRQGGSPGVIPPQPLVSQRRSSGVPTVGDLTGGLSATQLPVVGTVGSVTQTLPVTTLLGTSSPVTGVLQNVSGV